MQHPTPFEVAIPDNVVERILARVRDYRWFPAPEDDRWQYGCNTDYLQEICAYWMSAYDWRAAQADLNRFAQFKVEIDGLPIHYVHVQGEAGGGRPLIIPHGWPGSHYEFWGAIEKLAYPSRFGGSPKDSFDLVIPSLPGYGFSGKPKRPLGQVATANMFNTLMTKTLGYPRYIAQGGDWGSLVCSLLARQHEACAGIHLNMTPIQPADQTARSEAESDWQKHSALAMQMEGAYFYEQVTKPQSLALALMDSPVGVAAWILEKFQTWSDLPGGDLEAIYSKDQLLTNIMIYLTTDSFATSVWYYRAAFEDRAARLGEGERIEKPTGIANSRDSMPYKTPPRSWVERSYNVVHWTDFQKGGHFLAMEQPDLYVEDVRAFARAIGY